MLSIRSFPLIDNTWDSLFSDFWDTPRVTANYTSKVEDNKLYLEVDVPGVKKEDLLFDYDKGYLMLSWTRNDSKNSQSWYVGTKYDFEKSNVKLENGVLHMTVPLKKELTSSKINLLK